MSDTQTLERPETQTGHGEPQVAHLAPREKITDAYVFGTPIEALCGKVWVPSRDPKNLPVCEACKQIAESMFGPGAVERMQ